MINEQDKRKSNEEDWEDNEFETQKSIMIYKNGDAYAALLVEQIGQTRVRILQKRSDGGYSSIEGNMKSMSRLLQSAKDAVDFLIWTSDVPF